MLARTARLCMAEADGATGPLGADSSGAETTRYETVVRPLKREKDFVEMIQKEYLKYHIVAVWDCRYTGVGDHPEQRQRCDHAAAHAGRDEAAGPAARPVRLSRGPGGRFQPQLPDTVRDGDFPNIKQRISSVNRGKPYRSRAAKIFDEEEYHQRGMIEGIFGGEESKRHQLHCRFIRPDNRRRFGKIRAITWNIKVLNRLKCARMRGMWIPSYGTTSCV